MDINWFGVFLIYAVTVILACALNATFYTRKPKSFVDLLKLTFLPYIIIALIFAPHTVKD